MDLRGMHVSLGQMVLVRLAQNKPPALARILEIHGEASGDVHFTCTRPGSRNIFSARPSDIVQMAHEISATPPPKI